MLGVIKADFKHHGDAKFQVHLQHLFQEDSNISIGHLATWTNKIGEIQQGFISSFLNTLEHLIWSMTHPHRDKRYSLDETEAKLLEIQSKLYAQE